ncbi:phage tail protein I [Ancylobacter amanitiformis]|uniref:Phage tail P2-like protein n=1 Tax=Ancylobacter amanitiformis TaxID=217069 RepID=A0ABU0LQ86_9HYPH|nr:phage tail protein I [Ancylobacter amanitiformis]MDQ0510877.1 phage tail P2-like protein [Ancylobacter amanitiformis]
MTTEEAIAAAAPIADAILPPNASLEERAILTAEIARLSLIDPRVIASIWNPATCPDELLPWLAQGVSVDVWSDTWPEAQKRAVIAASPIVHRLKGTLGAVRRALAAFDLDARVVEWWEDDSRRGTFRVEITYQNGSPVFDPVAQGQAIEAVRAAKPKSRVFTTRAVLGARGPVYVGALAQSSLLVTAHPFAFTPPTVRAAVYTAATAATFASATAHPKT